MAVAASVKTTIVIKGNDQASKQIKKSTTAMGRLQASMSKATAKSRALGSSLRNMASGNVAGALSDVGGLLGGGAGGIAAAAGMATAATAALAVGVGIAAFKFTEWSSEIERARAALDNTFGDDGIATAISFADTIGGVGVESVQKLGTVLKASGVNAEITAKQMQELANRATQMGKSGDQALTAFAEAVQKGTTRSLAQVGVFLNATVAFEKYLEGTDRSVESLSQLERQQAVLNAVTKELTNEVGAQSSMYSEQDQTLARLSVAWTDLKFKVSEYLGGPAVGLLKNLADTIEFTARFGRIIGALSNYMATSAVAAWRVLGTAIAGVANLVAKIVAGESVLKLGEHMRNVTSDIMKAGVHDTAAAFNRLADAISNAGGEAKETVKSINFIGNAWARVNSAVAAGTALITSSAKAAKDAATARAKRLRDAANAAAKAKAAREKEFNDHKDLLNLIDKIYDEDDAKRLEKERQRLEAIEKRTAALGVMASAESQLALMNAANSPAETARLKNMQIEVDTIKQIAAIRATDSLTIQEQTATIDAVLGISHMKRMANLKTATDAQAESTAQTIAAQEAIAQGARDAEKAEKAATQSRIQGAFATAQASVGLAKELGISARAIAVVQMGLASAQAFLAFSMGNFTAGIAATTAAVQFGKIAFATPDTPSDATGGAASGSSGFTPSTAQPASTGGGGGASTYNININGVFATRAETGAAISQAMKAAANTGMATP